MQDPSVFPLSFRAAAHAARATALPPGPVPLQPPVAGGGNRKLRRRLRLWELPAACHCPVIGVCLPLDVVRRLAGKALGGKVLADDHALHAGAVTEARSRNRLSRLLQEELDQRHARLVRAFQPAQNGQELADAWQQAVADDDMAGAFWAALTHPQASTLFQDSLCRDMHMLQHQAGAQARAKRDKIRALLDENAILTRELGRAQQRCTRLLAERTADNQRLQADLRALQTSQAQQTRVMTQQASELEAYRQAVPELDARLRLQAQLAHLRQRQQADAQQIRQLQQEVEQLRQGVDSPSAPFSGCEAAADTASPPVQENVLARQTVLCVGGRSASLSSYRELIEQTGGRFAHHDGGLEQNCSQLDTSLAAADLVICQTGCISHNAYWRVKEFCKRHGKRCVFVANPSVSSLARSLEQVRCLAGDRVAEADAD